MIKQLNIIINLGIGDNIFLRIFAEAIKHKYSISVSHAKDALSFWFNNDPVRHRFNTQLGHLIFSEPPFKFVENPPYRFSFYPNDRICKELNSIPTKPNFDHLCVGTSLNLPPYIVITTKVRQFSQSIFERYKPQLTPALQQLAERYLIVIIGEKIVEKTKEYSNSVNQGQVFGIYPYLKSILPVERTVDLTLPALGVQVSSIEQFRQDCLILKEAENVINLGIGGNLWMSVAVAKKTIGLRTDTEPTTDLLIQHQYPGIMLTKNINEFISSLQAL